MILGIVCSPRARGNTELLVREALEGVLEAWMTARFFSVVGKKYPGLRWLRDLPGERRLPHP